MHEQYTLPSPGGASTNVSTYLTTPCTGDADCACWRCILELVAERRMQGWPDEWFGIGSPPIMLEGDDAR